MLVPSSHLRGMYVLHKNVVDVVFDLSYEILKVLRFYQD